MKSCAVPAANVAAAASAGRPRARCERVVCSVAAAVVGVMVGLVREFCDNSLGLLKRAFAVTGPG